MTRYLAFLSYSQRYNAWVDVLHRNLERVFGEGEVFLDRKSVRPGEAWVAALQRGLVESRFVLVVATPEAFASPWVRQEVGASHVQAARTATEAVLIPLALVDAPWPAFLEGRQRIDFSRAGEDAYRQSLTALVERLGGSSLPHDLEIPEPLDAELPADVRKDLVSLVGAPLERRAYRVTLATALGLHRIALEDYEGPQLAANAALVLSRGDDTAVAAAERVLRIVLEEYEEVPELRQRVDALRKRLVAGGANEAAGPNLISRYLDFVHAAHKELVPYFKRGEHQVLLQDIYVELDLQGSARVAGKGRLETSEDAEPGRSGFTIDEIVALDRAAHPWATGRWAVRGDPGAGKTTLLRFLAHRLAAPESRSRARVPIYAALPRLLREGRPLLEGLEASVSRIASARGLAAALNHLGEEGALVVLLDSLDEVPMEQRSEARELAVALAGRWKDSTVLLASRTIGFESPGAEFVELDIQPLSRERRLEFLARWFAPDGGEPDRVRAERELRLLEGHVHLAELASTPLYLTLMAILLAGDVRPAARRSELFDQIFDLLLEGKHRAQPEPIDLKETVRELLSKLAYALTVDEQASQSVGALENRLLHPEFDELRAKIERHGPWRNSLRRLLDDIATKTGILGPHDGPDEDWRFWHKSFGEALTAELLEGLYATGGIDACLEQVARIDGDEGRWAEPFALLAGRIPEGDELVEALTRTNRRLGLRALSTTQCRSPETLRRILTLSDNWEQRREVIEQIPEQVGDGERSVRLLERLARETTDGNDLYFLGATLERIGAEDARLAPLAQRARAQLFDHLAKPAFDDQFVAIPAGRFLMGTDVGDRKGKGDERPRHPVELARFELFRTPVTRAQYSRFDPRKSFAPGEENRPVDYVTWFEAHSFCRWLGGTLPTEAQWEYACRAGNTTQYWSGDDEEDLAGVGWYDENSLGRIHAVGEKPPNPFGLEDMHGNVFEWCLDWRGSYELPVRGGDGLRSLEGAESRVVRGGSFRGSARYARSAFRNLAHPEFFNDDIGFRPARASQPANFTPSPPPAAEGYECVPGR